MPQALSRAQREAAFLTVAAQMYVELESWYEQHPAASFGEIEAQARQGRRKLMGETLALLINGRSNGYQFEPPVCAQCAQPMAFEGNRTRQIYGLEGDSRLSRAYYVCAQCERQTLFPPGPIILCPRLQRGASRSDAAQDILRLRADHWSDGSARVAARQGLQAKSFDQTADAYSEAVGGAISADSVQRITQGWGAQLEAQRQIEAERASAPAARGESALSQRLATSDPIQEQANISTDGAMMLVRDEGWKEVKLTVISAVSVKTAAERAMQTERPSRRAPDPLVELSRHSYQAGLWDADTMAQHQYAEGLRRGVEGCARLSSVKDGAGWIERITQTNFPQATQIVDWSHARQRLWAVGNLALGEGSATAKAWVTVQLDALWHGRVSEVVNNLEELAAERPCLEVQQGAGYFRNNAERMRYAEYRAEGYPIGSGTVESAANTIIHNRLRRPGRGWKRENGQAMLAALSELHSDRFDHAWQSTVSAAA